MAALSKDASAFVDMSRLLPNVKLVVQTRGSACLSLQAPLDASRDLAAILEYGKCACGGGNRGEFA